MKETDIQLAICDYLALKRHFFWRQNTVPVFHDGRYRKMPAYSRNGVPDIILIHDGRFIGLEVKKPKGRQSEAQKDFQAGVEDAGAEYHIVTSVDDVMALGY